ncbi:MAG: SUMF1/EgtB/PvdO family nonheme iron enzyme [Deltaproteobacteria bacterium]|nr:SUMF1/EgtB/PvdO family nonheme iron enzyme [Deltaproteobacteria bacterium]
MCRVKRNNMGRFSFIFLFISFAFSGCLIEERCYNDVDCPSGEICKEGGCVFECNVDSDCDDKFGIEFVCDANHCRYPNECITCSFPNAYPACFHGQCSMGDCKAGFFDLNENTIDGCEYACMLTNNGVEICDEKDNNCDGVTDEGFDLDRDLANCGKCGNVCPLVPHSDPMCLSGNCIFVCHEGWYDSNKLADDGCEAVECLPQEEVCDGFDNDCDCPGDTNGDNISCGPGDEGVDEGFDKTLPQSCGPYCEKCEYNHAEPLCIDGECHRGDCDAGWYNADRNDDNGCECAKTNGGVEICDQIDNDCNGMVDEGDVCGLDCPADMVPVGVDFCIDIYEASRSNATSQEPGTNELVATSRPNVLPWIVNPMTYDHFLTFQAACQAVDKHLCTKEEWFSACRGPAPGTSYVFGNSFDKETCNCVDTFCDDYCEANGILPADCNTSANCGYAYYCFHEVPTGVFPACTNEYGTFDINGNAWEIVPSDTDTRGYEVRGGAYNCASASARLQCTYNAGWTALYAGFRCCKK